MIEIGGTAFTPLTPSLRLKIQDSFDNQIKELQAFEQNGLVIAQIKAIEMGKTLINGLPDGYPMPLKAEK